MINREPYFCQFALLQLKPFVEQFPIQYLNGQKGCRIAYRHFIQPDAAERKLLVIVNGRAENLLKWTELAYDFYQRGYDIVQFDHRGQGYSQRLLSDPEKGYIDEFRYYADDMASVIKTVNEQYQYTRQHLVAHSLGALISSYYLANYDHPIQSAVFSAPFFGVPLKSPLRDELIIHLMMLLGQGKRYVFGKTCYKPTDLDNNELSFCKTRMKWQNRINRKYPEIQLGGPTFRWVHLCLQAIKRLPKILSRIEIPVLVLQSDKEKIVSNQNLADLTALLAQGKLELIKNAKHEILFERDVLRENTIKRILKFFCQQHTKDS